jgi:hypothetical protein
VKAGNSKLVGQIGIFGFQRPPRAMLLGLGIDVKQKASSHFNREASNPNAD